MNEKDSYKNLDEKKCLNCHEIKQLQEFSKYKNKLNSICRDCQYIKRKRTQYENEGRSDCHLKIDRLENRNDINTYWNFNDLLKFEKQFMVRVDNFNHFKTFIESYNAICLSQVIEYIDCNTKLKIKCKTNHEFLLSENDATDRKWCPICTMISNKYESIDILEDLFGEKFSDVKQFDGFNFDLKLAIRCQQLKEICENDINH